MDSFLASMTFAQQRDNLQLDGNTRSLFCDCGDCEELPALFRQAIRDQKRAKRDQDFDVTDVAMKRTQERRLMQRCESGISIWEWTLPLGAEPLVEFGNSHRFVLVKSLSQHACIQTLGNGIIGSFDEESTRTDAHWQEGQAYFLPSNGGTAVGWFHKLTSPSSSRVEGYEVSSKPVGHAILIMFKIPSNKVVVTGEESVLPWAERLRRLCSKTLDRTKTESNTAVFVTLPPEDVKILCGMTLPENA